GTAAYVGVGGAGFRATPASQAAPPGCRSFGGREPARRDRGGESEGRGGTAGTPLYRAAARSGRSRVCGVAFAGAVPAASASGHERGSGGRVSLRRRGRARLRRGLRRPGPLLGRVVRVRPVGPLYTWDHHRTQHRAGRDRRLREVLTREVSVYAV